MKYDNFDIQLTQVAPNQYLASAVDNKNNIAAKQSFELRISDLKVLEELQRLEVLSVGKYSKETFHIDFGKELYNKIFTGNLGEYFKKKVTEAQNSGLRLRISFRFGENEMEIAALPWEFLHDNIDFLVTNENILISRLPLDVKRKKFKPIDSILRILVVISLPDDPERAPLDVDHEQNVIIEAVDKLNREYKVKIDFTEDAEFETIKSYLEDKEYHIVHFAGHGNYDAINDRGCLILENEEGNAIEVDNEKIAGLLVDKGLRVVVLSACQSGKVSNKNAYANLTSILVKKNIPAVVAMQYRVIDSSATTFASSFYQAIVEGKAVDLALTEARISMKNSDKSNGVDFATPVLYLSDPDCIQLGKIRPDKPNNSEKKPELLGELEVMNKGFIGRRKEIRALNHALIENNKNTAIIYGLGGLGKTVLATRFASKSIQHFDNTFGIKCQSNTRPHDILSKINTFLNLEDIQELNNILYKNISLRAKTKVLTDILQKHKFLIIFDNFEDCIDAKNSDISDPELKDFIPQLLKDTVTNTKFIFTTRINFNPFDGELSENIETISLPELPYPQMEWLMNTYEQIADMGTVLKKKIFKAIGGHPWALKQFAYQVSGENIDTLLEELKNVKHGIINYTLFEKSYIMLDKKDKTLLLRAAVYDEAVPKEAYLYAFGELNANSPIIDNSLSKLVNLGLITKQGKDEKILYTMHTMVRDFANQKLNEEKFAHGALNSKIITERAASYFESVANSYKNPGNDKLQKEELTVATEQKIYANLRKARDYYYKAEAWENAADITESMVIKLNAWGNIRDAKKLLEQTKETTIKDAKRQHASKHWLGTILHRLGDYENALKMFIEIKAYYRIGLIYQDQGEYGKAEKMFHLSIDQSPGSNAAWTYLQLGLIYQDQGDYDKAKEQYEKISFDGSDHPINAVLLHQYGMLNYYMGYQESAEEHHKRSLKMSENIKNEIGIASNKHQLGIIYRKQGNYDLAIKNFQASLKIAEDLENKPFKAKTLHQLGNIHKDQNNFGEAIDHYKKSLNINEKLGNRRGIAAYYYQLGNICSKKGNSERAMEYFRKSLEIDEEIENKRGIASNQYEMGMINYNQKNYPEAINLLKSCSQIREKLSNKIGQLEALKQLQIIFQLLNDEIGLANIFLRYGDIFYADYNKAETFYKQSLTIGERLENKIIISLSILRLGHLHYDLKSYDTALELFQEVLVSGEDVLNKKDIGEINYLIGNILCTKCDYEEALKRYQLCLKNEDQSFHVASLNNLKNIFEKTKDTRNLALTTYKLGNICLHDGENSKNVLDAYNNLSKALKLYQESLVIFTESGDLVEIKNLQKQITSKLLSFNYIINLIITNDDGPSLRTETEGLGFKLQVNFNKDKQMEYDFK
jgi:tetratricopeptide (TPR) repeat protein